MTHQNGHLSGSSDQMKRQKKEIYAELAKRFGLDPRTIERAAAKGAPVHDVQAMDAWFAEQKQVPGGSRIASLSDAKLEKIRKETERLQLKIDAEKKRLVPIDQVRRDMVRIANAMRSELMRFAGDVPNWEGLKAADMQRRVDEKVEGMCTDLADAFGELYK